MRDKMALVATFIPFISEEPLPICLNGIGQVLFMRLGLLLQLGSMLDPESKCKNLLNRLQWHVLDLRIRQKYEAPAKPTDPRVEPESPTRSYPFHHREKSRGNNNAR